MERTEIVKFWGSENLTRWSRGAVEKLGISEASKVFMTDVGLPSASGDPAWPYRFDGDFLRRLAGERKYVCITSEPRPICIDESGGNVVMPLVEKDRQRFVNSNVEMLGAFLTIFRQHQQQLLRVWDIDTKECRNILSQMEARMRKEDAAAFENGNCYWAVVIEEMWYPLLTDDELDEREKKFELNSSE